MPSSEGVCGVSRQASLRICRPSAGYGVLCPVQKKCEYTHRFSFLLAASSDDVGGHFLRFGGSTNSIVMRPSTGPPSLPPCSNLVVNSSMVIRDARWAASATRKESKSHLSRRTEDSDRRAPERVLHGRGALPTLVLPIRTPANRRAAAAIMRKGCPGGALWTGLPAGASRSRH
jgi:hypothetical protein